MMQSLAFSSGCGLSSPRSSALHVDGDHAFPVAGPAGLKISSKLSTSLFRGTKTLYGNKACWSREKCSKSFFVRADARDNANPSTSPSVSVAPLEPESPTGQFLVSILQSHPHLFAAAADQQLEQLTAAKDAAEADTKTSGSDLVLYRRIAEVKEQERRRSVEELIYALVVQRFLEAGISLVPKLSKEGEAQRVDNWPLQEKELESVHSEDVLELVKEHLAKLLGGRPTSHYHEQLTVVQSSKLRIGHLYAASIIYGYFLKRLDQRYQLERNIKALTTSDVEAETHEGTQETVDVGNKEGDRLAAEAAAAVAAMAASGSSKIAGSFDPAVFAQHGSKATRLRNYILSFDQDTLQRCATPRSKEGLSVIELHTQALFGKPEAKFGSDGSIVLLPADSIQISVAGLRRLVLEALAFGSYLWDVESYVDSHYSLASK